MAQVGSSNRPNGTLNADAGVIGIGKAHDASETPLQGKTSGGLAEVEAAESAKTFERLLAEILDRAYSVARYLSRDADVAEDLVQEAALRAFTAFEQFQAGTNFRAWFMRILTNCFFAQCRRKRREPAMTRYEDVTHLYLNRQMSALGLSTEVADPAAAVISRMGEHQVSEAIARLPEEFRLVCTLYFVDEASYRDIAEIIGCPVGTVRSRLHRGRRMLQKTLWGVAEEHGIIGRLARRSAKKRGQVRASSSTGVADATTA